MQCNENHEMLKKQESNESIDSNEEYDENLTHTTKESLEIEIENTNNEIISSKILNSDEPCEKVSKVWILFRGYIYVALFAFCTAVASILMKKSFTLSGSDSATIRYTIQLITMFTVAKWKGENPLGLKKDRKLLIYRGLAGVVGMISGFFAIKFINPSDFKAINHSSIVITAILARIFLKEKLTLAHILASLLTITGVMLISQPTFLFPDNSSVMTNATNLRDKSGGHENHLYVTIGVCFALAAAFGGGSAKVLLKKLCTNKVHFSIATIYASYFGIPISVIISGFLIATGLSHKNFNQELEHLPFHLCLTVIAGFVGVVGQVFLNLGLKYEDTAKLAIIKTIDVFFAFILQYLFLNISEDFLTIMGALTIISGAFLVLFLKLVEKKLNSKSRENNCCLTALFFKF